MSNKVISKIAGAKAVSLNELNNTKCVTRRNRAFKTETEKSLAYSESAAVKDVIFAAIPTKMDKTNIEKELADAFSKLPYETTRTGIDKAKDIAKCINRYVNSEKRTPLIKPGVMELNIYDVVLKVAPDMIFYTNKGLEIVKFKTSRPYLTAKEISEDMGLYALYCYGKSLVKVGQSIEVTASYYYLKKSNDSEAKNHFDTDFFDTAGKNIACISDLVDKTIYPEGERREIDFRFEEIYESYYIGQQEDEMDEEDCSRCDMRHICGYKYAPKYIVKEHKVKSIKDLSLTPQQEAAIAFNKGLARINAGAGAGKTLVTSLRVVTLLLAGVKPEEICMLTFTTSGANEMKERVQLYNDDFGTGADTSKLCSTTFNGFANDIVMNEYDTLGFTAAPTLIDNIQRCDIISTLLEENYIQGLNYKNFTMETKTMKGALPVTIKCFDIIKAKQLTIGDEEVLKRELGYFSAFMSSTCLGPILELYNKYDAILKQNNLIEFADQELLMFDVLKKDPYYFERMGFKHIIVDEFQDSNAQQIDLIKELRDCPSFESLMVVGDDSQAIFSFRDTSPEFIINFFDIMGEEGTDFFLLENHRSTPEIIDLANKINALNQERIEKDLIATRPSGKKPVVRGFFSSDEERVYIGEKIKKMIDDGRKPEEIAFIASDKYELLDMGSHLTEIGVPWVMLNPEPVLENPLVIATIAVAKAIKDTSNTEAILTYLNALYNNTLLSRSDNEIEKLISNFAEVLKQINAQNDKLKQKSFHDLIAPLDEDEEDELFQEFLKKIMTKRSFSVEIKYLRDFEKYGQKETYRRTLDYPGVVLTTAHSSKGLEWNVVFNSLSKYHPKEFGTGLQYVSGARRKRIEEKRRLLFVSLTRARDELYVTGKYVAFGPKEDRTYNMFLREVYNALGENFNPIDPLETQKEAERKKQARIKAAERRKKEKEKILKALAAAEAAEENE